MQIEHMRNHEAKISLAVNLEIYVIQNCHRDMLIS